MSGIDAERLSWVRAEVEDGSDEHCFEIAAGEGDLIHIRQTDEPDKIVTTTRVKWDAFVLGVRNNEFDHFVTGAAPGAAAGSASADGALPAGESPG
ncbi:DUF397 domain-containing protein [Streptomyces sp. ACA25]|uniref:DUF397 domain-containing protein n=1 Tax=Streptomyces sp. ACA25 TaxID=3022596 RepID=UPI0023075833|nr:DUF397 domain-containing protein [Streptomyces sp. ACA25]MDB1087907.1 DUF397 domain-containing protein [Streptomyces sp. ACA25]